MQKIPQCFVDKIILDDAIAELKSYSVIPFDMFNSLKLRQNTARFRCIQVTSFDPMHPPGTAGVMAA